MKKRIISGILCGLAIFSILGGLFGGCWLYVVGGGISSVAGILILVAGILILMGGIFLGFYLIDVAVKIPSQSLPANPRPKRSKITNPWIPANPWIIKVPKAKAKKEEKEIPPIWDNRVLAGGS